MKFPLFRRKKFRLTYLILTGTIIAAGIYGLFIPVFDFIEFDDESNFSSWITEISFLEKEYDSGYGSQIYFTMKLEIWNPGPFRIKTHSGSSGFSLPHSMTQTENITHPAIDYSIWENDGGFLVASCHYFPPGIRKFNWTGGIWINTTLSYSNPFLPNGNYEFVFGSSQWISRFGYNVSVNSSGATHSSFAQPDGWGEVPLNLGNPYWYILPILYGTLFTVEIILNLNDDKKMKNRIPTNT